MAMAGGKTRDRERGDREKLRRKLGARRTGRGLSLLNSAELLFGKRSILGTDVFVFSKGLGSLLTWAP
jgi:hypothetical protein